MDANTAKRNVKNRLEEYLSLKGIDPRRPFRCLNPLHNDSRPSMSVDRSSPSGPHCKCFACDAYYDTFDLIAIDYGLNDDKEIFTKAYKIFNLDVDYHNNQSAPRTSNPENRKQSENERSTHMNTSITSNIHVNNIPAASQPRITDIKETPRLDFTEQINAAHNELLATPEALNYLQGRGLSLETIKAYKLGYDKEGQNHLLKDFPQNQCKSSKAELYRYVFPYPNAEGRYNYFLTEIADRDQIDDFNGKYRKINKGESNIAAEIFNERYLVKNVPPVIFVCEGIYDALSVEEVGGKAIAFVGTAHKRFLGLCKKYRPDTTFIISLDNDEAGASATARVEEGLKLLNIPYVVKTAEQGKDFNEGLQRDRGAFTDHIRQIIEDVETEANAAREIEKQEYLQTSTAYKLQSFIDDIERSKTTAAFSTGFPSIDSLLDGGLYAGLYFIGAISSLGKTTFALQIADSIAASGQDVIIFSLEMARKELIAKSVSRLSLQEDLKRYKTTNHAKTTRGFTTGTRYKNYTSEEMDIIEAAITAYSEYAEHIYIHEGVGDIGVEEIRNVVKRHIKITGQTPVILIDYLQILSPYSERATDKQNVDKNVLELKRLSRDFELPVMGISSFNRDNYTAPVNMASFKESGAVEYSSDVLIALQYEGMDYRKGEKDGDRQTRIRELLDSQIQTGKSGQAQSIQVKILKNRNGSKGDTCLDFYPMFNYFCEKAKSGVPGKSDTGDAKWVSVKSSRMTCPF